jgi:hypothetical protein
MNRTDFLNEIMPATYTIKGTVEESGPDSRRVYGNKPKDVKFLKRVTREKIALDGAPIIYFPIKPESNEVQEMGFDNTLKDHTHLELGKPIGMMATWTPQEYQMDLSKWGIMMPGGSDQQLFIHVDEIEEKLGRKPLLGDIIETELDKTRYKIADVYFGHANLWENIFCMVTLTKITYDNYTSQLDKYEEDYKDTYTKLESVLDIMDGTTHHETNAAIQTEKRKTDNTSKPRKKSIDTGLDLMTMTL